MPWPSAAATIASAASSGEYTGATGRGLRAIRERIHSNCGVLTAGICTIVTCTPLSSCSSSARSDSQNPWSACFAPQYAAWSGMPRYASADPTWTMTPRSRGFM